jgi:hypothetical protein
VWLFFSLLCYASAAVVTFRGLRDWRTAFRRSSQLGPSDVHGAADLASEEEAARAARGQSAPLGNADLNLDY